MLVSSASRLDNKVIIVTGAGGGIGEVASALFAQEGARVVCADLNLDLATRTVDKIRAAGHTALAIEADITDFAACEAMAAGTIKQYGRIDGIFANAGVSCGETAEEISIEAWRRVIDINLTGSFQSVKAVLPSMKAAGAGSIVFQSSVAAIKGIKGTVSYSAAKAGLIGLSRQLAVEYAESGIRVNCVSPAVVQTGLVDILYRERALVRGTTAEEDLAKTRNGYPMKRLAQAEEVARTALFLLSDESSFTTGINMPVDGGYSAV